MVYDDRIFINNLFGDLDDGIRSKRSILKLRFLANHNDCRTCSSIALYWPHGLIQAATSIQEMTLSFVPKLFVVLGSIAIFASFGITSMSDYFMFIFEEIALKVCDDRASRIPRSFSLKVCNLCSTYSGCFIADRILFVASPFLGLIWSLSPYV